MKYLIILFLSFSAFAQSELPSVNVDRFFSFQLQDSLDLKNDEVLEEGAEARIQRKSPMFLDVACGMNISSFRDFATSPLFYSGTPFFTSLSHIDMDEKRRSQVNFSYAFGNFKSTFNGHGSSSEVHTISFNYSELFQLKKYSTSKFNLKVGGQLSSTVNLRFNPDLLNNSRGVDVISNLFASVKTTFDVSRIKERERKFLFIKYCTKRRARTLSFKLNVGAVNTSYRNGFAYLSSDAPINGDDYFADYRFVIFRGFRLNTALDYTVYLKNRNALQFSYLWDAYRTGGHHDNFEMAAHTLKCSLLFKLR